MMESEEPRTPEEYILKVQKDASRMMHEYVPSHK
jgi:hypothetical protein